MSYDGAIALHSVRNENAQLRRSYRYTQIALSIAAASLAANLIYNVVKEFFLNWPTLAEADVEAAAIDWLEGLGWQTVYGPDIPPDTPNAERDNYDQVILDRRLRDALASLNPGLPSDALDDAFRKLTRPQGTTVEARNRAFHRMLVNGVGIEYRDAEGRLRGDQVRVIDFKDPANNDWLAVNQFTVTENRNTRRPDVVLFVNGLPLGLIELKNPADEDATIRTAWNQPPDLQGRVTHPVRHE